MDNEILKEGDLITGRYIKGIALVTKIKARYYTQEDADMYGVEVGGRYGDLVHFKSVYDKFGNPLKGDKNYGAVDVQYCVLAKDFILDEIEKMHSTINRFKNIIDSI